MYLLMFDSRVQTQHPKKKHAQLDEKTQGINVKVLQLTKDSLLPNKKKIDNELCSVGLE